MTALSKAAASDSTAPTIAYLMGHQILGSRVNGTMQFFLGVYPMGKLFFNILATFAEFEADLIRLRTREGIAVARAKGKLRGKQPKLSLRQQKETRPHAKQR